MNKKIKQFILKGLITSILFCNAPINSLAGTLLEDTRYEIFEGNNIQIDNILEEGNVDIEIEGNTMLNLANQTNSFRVIRQAGQIYGQYTVPLLHPLKSNTTYTIYLTVEDNKFNHAPFTNIVIGQGDTDDWSYRICWDREFNKNNNDKGIGRHKAVFTTHSRVEESSHKWIRFIFEVFPEFDTTIKDIVLVEGHHDGMIEMFSGMKSVGSSETNEYKLNLLSTNNLLLDDTCEQYSENAYINDYGEYLKIEPILDWYKSLNIRENTEATYKQFTGIKEKVVLKDNCSDGNEQYHTIDLKLNGNNAHKTDVYKTVIKFEIEQK